MKYAVRAKLDALASPLITVIYKIGIKIANTEKSIDREAITKNNLPKLTQSFVPVLRTLARLSRLPISAESAISVSSVSASPSPIKA